MAILIQGDFDMIYSYTEEKIAIAISQNCQVYKTVFCKSQIQLMQDLQSII